MDAKEALRYFKEIEFVDLGVDEAGREDPHIVQAREAKQAAISALEKVDSLEAENAKGFTYHFPFRINQKIWYITEWDKYSLQKNHAATIRQIHVGNSGISFSVLDGKNYHTFKLDDIGTNVFLNKKDWRNARMKKLAVKR